LVLRAKFFIETPQLKIKFFYYKVVQFCNINQYDGNFDSSIILPFVNDGTVNASDYPTVASYLARLNDYYRAQLIKGARNGQYSKTNLTFDITQMLVSCRFQDADCTVNDFFQYYDYYYGFCYRFNQGKDLSGNTIAVTKVGQAGIKYGLQLELYAGYASDQEKFMATRGFRVLVFNKSDLNQIAQEVGIEIATGHSTNIAVQRTVSSHLPAPYGDCLPNTDDEIATKINWTRNSVLKFMYDHYIDGSYYAFLPNPETGHVGPKWNWTLTYNQFFCLKMCFQKYLYEQCGCYDITVPFTPKNKQTYVSKACISGVQLNCKSEKQRYFYSEQSLFGDCYANCPIECEQIKYDLKISSSSYPTQWYAAQLATDQRFNTVVNRYFNQYGKENITYVGNFSDLKNAVAKLNVYYDDLSYTKIDETPAMTFDIFLGSVGGNMGLFLGFVFLYFNQKI
jgi:hypothetical protein